MESIDTPVYKFTLSSKKEIYLREPKISDSESCIQIAGLKAGENVALLGLLTQKELFKKLLVQVDSNKPKMAEKEDLEKLFTYREWSQCIEALQQITGGGDDKGKLSAPEIMSSGSK